MASPEFLNMMGWMEVYYSTFSDHEDVEVDSLKWLIRERAGSADPDALAVTLAYADQLSRPVDEGTIKGVLTQLYDADLAGRAGAVLARYERGEDIDIAHELEILSRNTKRAKSNGKSDDYERTDIATILGELENNAGIKFRNIPLLYDSVAAIQGGASIAIGARPDKGKTSLIADILRDWAPQCIEFFGQDRPILWLNNEGTAKRIKPRLYQAALGLDLPGIMQMSNQGILVPEYLKALGSDDVDYIRVKDVHGASLAQIEQIIEDMNPCVVIYDMLANVRMGSSEGGNKADAVEQAWQTVREFAVVHNHIALSTVQISDPGGNQLFPPYNFLKDSRTGIQGATDLILMIGSLDNAAMDHIRGISTPKNKFAVSGFPSYAQGELFFDKARCRFSQGDTPSAVTNEGPHMGQRQGAVAIPSFGGGKG